MPDEPEPTQQPPPSFGQDTDDAWADVIGRLRKVRPLDPPPEAIDRVWAKVVQRIDDVSNPVVKSLLGVELREPEPAAIERIWHRISRRIMRPRPTALAQAGNRIHWGWALASLILVFALLLGTVNTVAASALPGEELYPAKRAFEAVRWSLAFSPHSRAEFALVLAERRQSEAEQLVSLGAPTQLVSETLDEALTNLIIATPSLPPQVITSRVDQLRSAVQAWPPSYQVAVSISVSGRLDRINKMMSGLNGIAPSPTPRPKSPIQDTSTPTPTATPTLTQTPESLQNAAPSAATPTPTQTPSLTPTPTQTPLPTFTSTPTKTSKPRVRPTEKPTQKPPTETSVPPTQPPPTKPPKPTATPAPKPTNTPPYPYP
jgi:hypothetical protein